MSEVTPNKNQFFEILGPKNGPLVPVIGHIPHSSTRVPDFIKETFVPSEEELEAELKDMTDHFTDELFDSILEKGGILFVNRLSRLVFDPERFPDDCNEPMSKIGMGAVYTKTSKGTPLRNLSFNEKERGKIIDDFFYPYMKAIEHEISEILRLFDKCLIIDCHSFPAEPLPYEDSSSKRPDICLGFDDYHGPADLIDKIEITINKNDMSVLHNTPFSGSYVPAKYYQRDRNVKSLMIELNRGTYLDESKGTKSKTFYDVKGIINEVVDQVSINF